MRHHGKRENVAKDLDLGLRVDQNLIGQASSARGVQATGTVGRSSARGVQKDQTTLASCHLPVL